MDSGICFFVVVCHQFAKFPDQLAQLCEEAAWQFVRGILALSSWNFSGKIAIFSECRPLVEYGLGFSVEYGVFGPRFQGLGFRA